MITATCTIWKLHWVAVLPPVEVENAMSITENLQSTIYKSQNKIENIPTKSYDASLSSLISPCKQIYFLISIRVEAVVRWASSQQQLTQFRRQASDLQRNGGPRANKAHESEICLVARFVQSPRIDRCIIRLPSGLGLKRKDAGYTGTSAQNHISSPDCTVRLQIHPSAEKSTDPEQGHDVDDFDFCDFLVVGGSVNSCFTVLME